MDDWLRWPPTWATVLLLPALFVGFTVHELAHALVAYLLGDTSQVERQRLSFNPLRHVSWIGMAVFLLFGFGWAKPVWVDHTRFHMKNRALGTFLVSVAGVAANLLAGLATLFGILTTVSLVWLLKGTPAAEVIQFLVASSPGPDAHGLAVALSYYMMVVNLLLAVFNLIPLPPLDGFQALMSLVMAARIALQRKPAVEAAHWPGARPQPATPAADEVGPDTSPAQIHFQIALAYHKDGQWDEAIARYRQATAHDQNFSLAYYNLGLAYWAKGRLPLAVSAFRAAVESPGDPDVRLQADRRLRTVSLAEQDPTVDPGPVPPLLESSADAQAGPGLAGQPTVDPAMARRVWLRLAAGGIAGLILAISAWVFVTVVAFLSAG